MFTPEFFNTLIVLNMVVGLGLAARCFYIDMTRKPKHSPPPFPTPSGTPQEPKP